MTIRRLACVTITLTMTALLGSACTLASPMTIQPVRENEEDATASKGKDGGASSTTAPPSGCSSLVKADVGKLKACGNNKGHCYDKTKVPGQGAIFGACENAAEVCVPDEVLKAGGDKLKSCKVAAMNGAAGGCITIDLVPEMKKQGGAALKQDVCDDPGQVCAPCNDPTNGNAPTPFCAPIGVSETACTGGGGAAATNGASTTAAAPCCTTNGKSNGICMGSSSLPQDMTESLKQDSCAAGNLCIPAALASQKPVMCGSHLFRGICMDSCFNDMMALVGTIGILDGEGCGPTELCIPCFGMKMMAGDQPIPGCN